VDEGGYIEQKSVRGLVGGGRGGGEAGSGDGKRKKGVGMWSKR